MIIEKILKPIWQEFIYGGHIMSLGAASIVYTASLLLNLKITWDFLLIVYLGTDSVCLYNRYKEFQIDFLSNPERTKYIEKHIKKIPSLIFFFSLIILAILILNKNLLSLIFTVFLLLMGMFYSEFFKKITQKIIGFKDFFVALTGSLLILLLAIYYSIPINLALFLFFVFVFFELFVNVNFFDIKDIETDKQEGLKTLAIVLGQNRLLQLLNIIAILAVLPLIIGVYLRVLPISSLMLFLTIPYTFFYFKQLENKNISPYFLYNVIVDGEFIFWLFFVLSGNFIFTKL